MKERRIDRRQAIGLMGGLSVLGFGAFSDPPRGLSLNGITMGTRYRVEIRSPPGHVNLPPLRSSIERLLQQTEALMSIHSNTSELTSFNRVRNTDWLSISPLTCRVVSAALSVGAQSMGAFNAAAAPLAAHWGFGPRGGYHQPIQSANIDSLIDEISNAGIEIADGWIRKGHPRAMLDLNAIAKGDALDRMTGLLDKAGCEDYLVEIGGEVRVRSGRRGKDWLVGIEHPLGGVLQALSLRQSAVATSGAYVNFYEHDGTRYSHLLDPRSARPVRHPLSLVSVVADTAMEADAWATALFVMGDEQGWEHALAGDMAAIFLLNREHGWRQLATPAFKRLQA